VVSSTAKTLHRFSATQAYAQLVFAMLVMAPLAIGILALIVLRIKKVKEH
jgi:hypothetical protein